MKRLSQQAVENLAHKFRAEQGLSATEAINLKSLLRKLNILTLFRPLSESFYGISLKSPGGSQFLLINANSTKGRQHYTIAHELYHLFYDEHCEPHVCAKSGGKNGAEYNADAFAAALLMPCDGVMQFLSNEEIKRKNVGLANIIKLEQYFSVSRLSLLIRLKNLGLLSPQAFESLSKISVKESAVQYGYDTALYSKGVELVIGDFGERARTLYERNVISEGHYLELLNLLTDGKN